MSYDRKALKLKIVEIISKKSPPEAAFELLELQKTFDDE